jgi:hypothetical protein
MISAELTQERVDAAFDLAERQEWEIMALAGRAELAYATVAMCSAYLGMLRRHHEAQERGELMDLAARSRIVREHYGTECETFFVAWQRGGSSAESLRAVEVAVHGFAGQFDSDDHTRAAGERMLLDFMRHAIARHPAQPRPGAVIFADPLMAGLGERLEALLAAYGAEGGDQNGEATRDAVAAVREAIGATLAGGCALERMQAELDRWTDATGGPAITVTVSDTSPS